MLSTSAQGEQKYRLNTQLVLPPQEQVIPSNLKWFEIGGQRKIAEPETITIENAPSCQGLVHVTTGFDPQASFPIHHQRAHRWHELRLRNCLV